MRDWVLSSEGYLRDPHKQTPLGDRPASHNHAGQYWQEVSLFHTPTLARRDSVPRSLLLERREGAGGEKVLAHGGVEVLQRVEVLLLPALQQRKRPFDLSHCQMPGSGISRSLQIFRARKSLISRWRRTEELFRAR